MRKGFAVNQNDHIKVYDRFTMALPDNCCFLCAGHNQTRKAICPGCLNDLAFNTEACPACAKPSTASKICADCLNQPWISIDNTWALFQYRYPVNQIIQHLKFKQGIDVANFLGSMLAELFISTGTILPDSVIPVPLHSSRLISRGYNQSVELSRSLSKQLGVDLDTVTCKRVRATLPQTDLPVKKRKQNVRNAFSVSEKISYSHVLLVDDVITTGSTINELARTLRHAGVKKIDVLACTRAG